MVDCDEEGDRDGDGYGDGDAAAWYQPIGFPSNSSLLWLQFFFFISLRSGNRFHLFGIYRIFCFNSGEFKNGSRVVVFGSGDSL